MRLIALFALPAFAAFVMFALPTRAGPRGGPAIGALVGVGAAHLALTMSLWARPAASSLNDWLAADALGLVVLTLTSVLFFATALYAVGYLRRERPRGGRVFVTGLLAFLAGATVVALAHHLALLWVGIEA